MEKRRPFKVAWVEIDPAGRVRLPTEFVERIDWLAGDRALEAWLFVIAPGRYRLLSPQQVRESVDLRTVLERCEEAVLEDPCDSEAAPAAALPLRLVSTTVSPRGPGWRLTIPREIIMLVPPDEDRSHAYLLFSSGYLEIWLPGAARRATGVPLHEAL